MQCAFQRAGAAGEERRVGGGRVSAGVSGDVDGRDESAADGGDVSQPGEHGCGGDRFGATR